MRLVWIIIPMILFSSTFVGTAYGSIFLDKGVYTWTDKIHITVTEHGLDLEGTSVKVSTSDHEINNYKLSKAGNGLYTGEIILTGFLHDVNGDGEPDTNPRTTGNGPNNGFLETKRDGKFTISIRFSDGDKINKSAMISWNESNIVFDMPNYTLNESAKLQVTDIDMNLNPETLDTIQVHVYSDSDKAGIQVDAIETQEESGLFEATFSFVQDSSSSGNRLFAKYGDKIYAQYDDHTLPKPYDVSDDLAIIAESIISNDSQPSQKTNPETEQKVSDVLPPPLKQIKSGVPLVEIQCNEGKHIVYKSNRMAAACVTDNTEFELIKRGWALLRLTMYDVPAEISLCQHHGGNWLDSYNECEYVSTQQCSLMGGEFNECESACRHDHDAEVCTLQCVPVCSLDDVEKGFHIIFTKQGGIAGIDQKIVINSYDGLINIEGFNEKKLGPISDSDAKKLSDMLAEIKFLELESKSYPPSEGWADYFTYSLHVYIVHQDNKITWTDASSDFPEELFIISQEIERQVEYYSDNN